MADNQFVRNLLGEQRKRLVGSIMTYAEGDFYESLSRQQQKDFRDKVLQSVGVYHDTVLDILKSSVDDGFLVNEEALRMIAQIHAAMNRG